MARADAPKPEIKSITPFGIPAGRTAKVTIQGVNLAPKSITVDKSPLTVKINDVKPDPKDAKNVTLTLDVTVPANCPRNTYDLTLANADKATATCPLTVMDDTVVTVKVKKPASSFALAMPLPGPSVTIDGAFDFDNADVFRLEAKAGETWEIAALGYKNGDQESDPVLRIKDARHFTRVLSVGDKRRQRRLAFKPTQDGTYYIEVMDSEGRGDSRFKYLLTVNRSVVAKGDGGK